MEFVFESSPWEQLAEGLEQGNVVSASYLLTVLEGEDEESVEQALAALEERAVQIDLSDLPRPAITGENGTRLRLEAELVKQDRFWLKLEETDPLRLYMEELETAADDLGASLHEVVQLAKDFTGWGVLLSDLIQEGSLGLWKAEGDARYRVTFYMQKAVLQQARAAGVGQKLSQSLEDFRSVDEKLLAELGRNPTLEEIAQQLHVSEEEAAFLSGMLDNVRRMDRVKTPEKPEKEEEEQAVENTAYFQMRQRITGLLSTLPPEDARLLSLRFGLDSGLPLTPEQTGRKLGLTADEVVQKEAAALLKLRNEG